MRVRLLARVLGLIASVGAFVGAFSGAGSLLGAQELRGTVTLGDAAAGVPGVIVEASDPLTGESVGRTLTDARGYFILRLPAPGTVSVRGLRIGQRPSEFGTFSLAADEIRTERFSLTGAAIVLDRISIVGRSVCGVSRDTGLVVATLLDEARKVLRSTQLTSTEGRLHAEWALTSQLTSLRGDPITAVTAKSFRSSTDQPFVSLPPDSLAVVGYLEVQDNEFTYHAPDADVLLSERFVDEHCFQPEPWQRDDRDWIGMGFKPARNTRGVVGIQGTLWFDRRSAELRLLEYRYVNLPRSVSGTPAGGDVAFLRLPGGSWLVHRWQIRMPRPTETEEAMRPTGLIRGSRRVTRINSMEVAGGEVREIRSGARVIYAAADGGEIRAVERNAATVALLCESAPGANQGVLWGTARDAAGNPVQGATIELEWKQNMRWIADWQRSWETRRVSVRSEADGSFYACGQERGAWVTVRASKGDTVAPPMTVRIPPREEGVEFTVRFDYGAAATTVTGTVFGSVFDSLRTGAPWRDAEVRVVGGRWSARADSAGRFALDSLPPGVHELAVYDDDLRLLRVPPPTSTVRVGADGSAESVRLSTPSAAAHFAAVCGRAPELGEGLLIGEVRDLAGVRRGGLRVYGTWSRTLVSQGKTELDPRAVEDTTDADGTFALCGVPLEGEVSKTGDLAVYSSGETTVAAEGDRFASGAIGVRLDGVALRRRDLVVGTARDVARLSGRVLDQLGQPIPEATVVVGGIDGVSTRTDSTGRWTLDGVLVRSTRLAVRALRYAPFERELDPVAGRLSAGEIRLEPAPQILAAQLTTARGGRGPAAYRADFEERKRTYAFGTFIDDAMLERQPVVTPQFIIRQIPKARHSTQGALIGKSKIGFETDYGALNPATGGAMSLCFPRWFVDGTDFGVPQAEEEEMWLRQAKRVEVYKAGLAPAQYNDFDGCGVILIWTR
jgi:protocatechuate 3,4-dioxygenase beta subunit